MIVFLDILSFAIMAASTFFVYQILATLLSMRGPLAVRLLAFLPCITITGVVIYPHDATNMIGLLAGFMIYMAVFYKGGWIQKLSIVLIFCPMILAVNFLMEDLGMRVYYALPIQTMLYSTLTHAISLIFRALVWFAAWKLSRRRFADIMVLLNTKMWLLLDSVCAAVLVGLLVVLNFLPEAPQIGYPVAFASIVTVFGCLHLIGYIAQSVQTGYQLEELRRRHQYYEDKLKDEERVRAIYHDIKNHLLLLQSAEKDGYAGEMIAAIQEQISGYENYYKTGNTFLDVIIRDKAEKAKESKIDFAVMLHFEDGGFMEPLDISAIFGNALDNAIEASLKLPVSQRLVTVKANRVHTMLSIAIENHAADTGAEIKTSKQDKLLHGFGLKNIEQAVMKYDGQCAVKQKDGCFALTIILPIP